MGRPKASKLTGKFYLRTDRNPDKNGKYAIYIDYNIGAKHARTDTEVWVEENIGMQPKKRSILNILSTNASMGSWKRKGVILTRLSMNILNVGD